VLHCVTLLWLVSHVVEVSCYDVVCVTICRDVMLYVMMHYVMLV